MGYIVGVVIKSMNNFLTHVGAAKFTVSVLYDVGIELTTNSRKYKVLNGHHTLVLSISE